MRRCRIIVVLCGRDAERRRAEGRERKTVAELRHPDILADEGADGSNQGREVKGGFSRSRSESQSVRRQGRSPDRRHGSSILRLATSATDR
jgi:hypothetical protein